MREQSNKKNRYYLSKNVIKKGYGEDYWIMEPYICYDKNNIID